MPKGFGYGGKRALVAEFDVDREGRVACSRVGVEGVFDRDITTSDGDNKVVAVSDEVVGVACEVCGFVTIPIESQDHVTS